MLDVAHHAIAPMLAGVGGAVVDGVPTHRPSEPSSTDANEATGTTLQWRHTVSWG